jgi:hypothetical protein
LDWLIELEPDRPDFLLAKAECAFHEKADSNGVHNAYEALPSSLKDDPLLARWRVYYAACERDFAAAEEIVSKSRNEEMFFVGAYVPRQIVALSLELIQGNHPAMEEFGAAREQLYRKVQADPTNPFLMTALAFTDVALGRKEESIEEGRRAIEMRPISEDALDGPAIATNVAMVYAWANRPDIAFEQLDVLVQIPAYLLTYGDLKTYPGWEPLRKDPRFERLLAQMAPRD